MAKSRAGRRGLMTIGVKLANFTEFAEMLRGLPAAMESRVMGDALGTAAKPIVAAAKQRVPKDTGALRRSLTSVVRRYPRSGKVIAVIGPDKDYYGSSGKRLRRGQSRYGSNRPSKYAHLVEFGHHTVDSSLGQRRFRGQFLKGKPTATSSKRTWVPARPFLRPAVTLATPEATAALADGVRRGMEREIKRLSRKMKRISGK